VIKDAEVRHRRKEARTLIDKILNGTPDGRVNPEIAASLRQQLARYPGQPDRALMEHMREAMRADGIAFDAQLPEDLWRR